MKKRKYIENDLQVKCVRWFRRTHKDAMIWCSLNGVASDPRRKKQWKKDGMLNGVPDLQILYQDKTIFIELKRPITYKKSKLTGNKIQKREAGKLRPEQIEFIEMAENLGHSCYVVDTLEEFKKIVTNLLT